jgi:hypothetical protein
LLDAPAQIRTCGVPAYGSYLGCLTASARSAARLGVRVPAPVTRWPGPAPGACFGDPRSPWSPSFSPPAPPRLAPLCSPASSRLRRGRLLEFVHHRLRLLAFPMRTRGVQPLAKPETSQSLPRQKPGFRHDPIQRDGFFDHGRVAAPCMTAPFMLPSALRTASAPAISRFRGSIAHPTRLLCTLRLRCRHRRRNTHYQAGATPYLDRTCTGWIAPASLGAREVRLGTPQLHLADAPSGTIGATSTSRVFRMRRQNSTAPERAMDLVIAITRLIDLPIDKVRPEAGASSSQYLENQSGSGRNGPRHAAGSIGRSPRRGVTPGLDLGICSSDPLARKALSEKFDRDIAPDPTLRCEAAHTGPSLSAKRITPGQSRRLPSLPRILPAS